LVASRAELTNGALIVTNSLDISQSLVSLKAPASGVNFTHLPGAGMIAVRYASTNYGTITASVNGQQGRKINIHSSGDEKASFLYAVIDLAIPEDGTLTLSHSDGDTGCVLDHLMIGRGDLGLKPDIWNLPPLPVCPGPYQPDWHQLSRTYRVPDWFRDAKFGAWAHWDPQSMPEQGDWYARRIYDPGDGKYFYHWRTYGHVSEFGYKDICNLWKADKWNPEEMMRLYVEMGAKYFMALGAHHDNFDCWDSKFQPWNAVNIGPKRDIVGTWEKVAREHGLHFGIGFHNSPPRTWGQFMTMRYRSDPDGLKKGVPYDAMMTIADGKGKWWEGLDPVDLYGPPHNGKDPLASPYANQFMWRVDDALNKYHPDLIYFDEHAGNSQVDLGIHMGLDFLAPQIVANFYNKSLLWNKGKMEVVVHLKGVGGMYNSFQKNPELLPLVDQSLVKSTEAHIEPMIMAYPFATETSTGEWHYSIEQHYLKSAAIVRLLIENVCRNGNLLLNLSQHGDGHLDEQLVENCKDVGTWLRKNGEAVYGTRPFEVFGEGNARYTRANGFIYATLFDWPSQNAMNFTSLKRGGATIGNVSKVEIIGSDLPVKFLQDEKGLQISTASKPVPDNEIKHNALAAMFVLKITQDKHWINDDDPGVIYSGWVHHCNLGTGDYNNDLHLSDVKGESCDYSFEGVGINVIAPTDPSFGSVEITLDGKSRGIISLKSDLRKPQQVVFTTHDLPSGKHHLVIVNHDNLPVALDALAID
jgi:alpha-L-fucosidase